jgi:hypothetical protein
MSLLELAGPDVRTPSLCQREFMLLMLSSLLLRRVD